VEARHLEVEHGTGVLGVDEVVGHRLVDGHGHGPGAVGRVAAVDGDGLVVHGESPSIRDAMLHPVDSPETITS
jgi:hypothetical protein